MRKNVSCYSNAVFIFEGICRLNGPSGEFVYHLLHARLWFFVIFKLKWTESEKILLFTPCFGINHGAVDEQISHILQ